MTQYSLQWLLEETEQGSQFEYLFFWGHTNKSNNPTGDFIFSQWYPSPFTVDGVIYKTAEHWMMAAKARLFKDFDILDKIIHAETPREAKSFGRKVKGFVTNVWDDNCFQIVVEGNRHKFSQHDAFKEFLLSTGRRVIVEASPVDAVWGIGLAQNSEQAKDPHHWRGQNLLGFALMQVRDILQQKPDTALCKDVAH